MLKVEDKKKVVDSYKKNEKDTGSPEVQIALLTSKVNELTEHLKTHQKDHSSRRGLLMMVGARSSLLKYLGKTNPTSYRDIINRLGLRK